MVIFRALTVTLSHYATVAKTQQRRSARTNRRKQKFLKKGEKCAGQSANRAASCATIANEQRTLRRTGDRRSGDLRVQQSGSVLAELTHSLEQT